jgi:hypothetical protein
MTRDSGPGSVQGLSTVFGGLSSRRSIVVHSVHSLTRSLADEDTRDQKTDHRKAGTEISETVDTMDKCGPNRLSARMREPSRCPLSPHLPCQSQGADGADGARPDARAPPSAAPAGRALLGQARWHRRATRLTCLSESRTLGRSEPNHTVCMPCARLNCQLSWRDLFTRKHRRPVRL